MRTAPAVVKAPDNRAPINTDARLTKLVEKLVSRGGVHHANVSIASGDGEQQWSAAAGPADYVPQPDTPFFIASITKRFIITLVLQAHERGELDLSAPILHYLSAETIAGLHIFRGADWTPKITVRHLASHTSGLPDHFETLNDGTSLNTHLATGQDLGWTFDDMIRTTRQQQRPYFKPQDLTASRQKARYSDTGFQLLIRILETVTGNSFDELLTERIFDPLSLTSTWLPRHRRLALEVEPSPLYTKQRRVDLTTMLESTNDLFSTNGDLLTFQRALLSGEIFRDPDTRNYLTERRNRLRNIPVLN
ncbi:MAG TPA: beta-lactamase family protein [Candidatus Yaniella excrementigallinarum]|nr:beta-lactamase family protein [Candidatus Yaniella excrementigallinarum]